MATQGKILVYKRQGKKGITYTYRLEAGRDPATGKRKRISKSGFKTAKEARAAAQPLLNKLLLGKNITNSNITFEEYLPVWLNEYEKKIKKGTIKNVAYFMSIVARTFGKKPLKDFTIIEFQNFLNNYPSVSSAKDINMYTKILFKTAMKYGVICSAPILECENPIQKNIQPKNVEDLYLTKQELNNVLMYAKDFDGRNGEFFYYFLFTLAYTGMRLGETCALLWKDIDLDNKEICIRSTMFATSKKNYFRQDSPKTKSSIRRISFDNDLLAILKQWRIKQIELRLKYGLQNNNIPDYVFTKIFPKQNKEYPIINSCIQQVFRTINNRKVFKKHLYAHLFRHTHVSLLAEAGVSLQVIKERLGHSDDKLTEKIYLHITKKMKENSAKIFEKYMAQ